MTYTPDFARPLSTPVALPIAEAEALISTLPGVISARITDVDGGAGDIHVLADNEVPAKQTVRNVESALLAHYGVRVDHRKISVATTTDGPRVRAPRNTPPGAAAITAAVERVCFEDVEIRRSSRMANCKVTLRRGSEQAEGDSESPAGTRAQTEELAAMATIQALGRLAPEAATLALEGARVMQAFGREFVFVGVNVRQGRGTALLAGSAEVRESVEIAAALAVLDATNRWVGRAAR